MRKDLDRFKARTQAILSYLYVAGFFILVTLQGIGIVQGLDWTILTAALMLVLGFWFQRQRNEDSKPDDKEQP